MRCQPHRLPAVGMSGTVVLVAERHLMLICRDEAAVRDGDAVCVAREITEHGLRPGERALGIDDPFDLTQGPKEACELCRVAEIGMLAVEVQLPSVMRLCQPLKEQSPKEA